MLVIVGGHSRNIGKTSVVCAVIRALPEAHWTAIKITQYGHGICAHEGEACECADPIHPVAVSEEQGGSSKTDSGRFLAAGARRAIWLRTPGGKLGEALPRLRRIVENSEHVIVESNSLLRFFRPDLCLMVLDGAVADFKPTSRQFLDRAHALVVTSEAPLSWPDVPPALLRGKPRFAAPPPDYRNELLIETLLRPALKDSLPSADSTHG